MNYEEFKERLMEEVKENLYERDINVDITTTMVEKNESDLRSNDGNAGRKQNRYEFEFPGLLWCLCYVIFNDKIKKRKSDISELGVRVQNSGRHSDSTADVAISKVEIRKAVMNCDFSGDELDGIPKKDIYCEMAYLLRNMRADFELFNSQLKLLDDDDSKIF